MTAEVWAAKLMLKQAEDDYGKVKDAMQRFRVLDGAWPGEGIMAKATGEAAKNWKVVRDSLTTLDHQQEEATLDTLSELERSVVAYTTARDYWERESAASLFDTPLNQRVEVKLSTLQVS